MKRFREFARSKLKIKSKTFGVAMFAGLLCSVFLVPKMLNAAGVVITTTSKYSVLMKGSTTKAYITTVKTFPDGVYGYCMDERLSAPPSGSTIKPTGSYSNDKVYRVIKSGFPQKKWFSGNSDRATKLNYYITQLAVWHFTDGLDLNTMLNSPKAYGASKLSNITDAEVATVKKGIKELVDIGNNSADKEKPSISASKYNLTAYDYDNHKYIATDYITVKGNNISGNIKVKLEGAPSGTQVIDSKGAVRTSYKSGEKFYIRMPYQFGSGSFKFSLSANSNSVRGIIYEGGNQYQEVVRYEPIKITVNASSKGTITWNEKPGNLEITKTGEGGALLPGAVFRVSSTNPSYSKDFTTGSNGKISVSNLVEGTYTVKEIKAPPGYVLNSTSKNVTVPQNGTGKVTIANTKAYGSFTLHKEDVHSSAKLANATFRVWSDATGYDAQHTTNSSGVLTVNNLPLGKYKVQEVKAPSGYQLDDTIYVFDLTTNGQSPTLNLTNHPDDGQVTVIKKGAQSKLLKGAVFRLTGPNNYSQEKTTGDNGQATWTKLPPGKYTLTEVSAPPGYDKSPQSWSFTISSDSNQHSYTQEVLNTQTKHTVKLLKTDAETGEPLAGAQFRITGPNGYDKTLSSNSAGIVSLPDAIVGQYTIQEIAAPTGYVLSTTKHTVDIQEAGKTYEIEIPNVKIKGNIEILKVDARTNEPLAGAQFTITGPNNYSKTVTTNEQGIATLSNLPYGTYTVNEVKAPDNYTLNSTPHTIQITEDGKTYKIKHQNERKKGAVRVLKTSDDGSVLQGATFELKNKNDASLVYTGTTDASGQVSFTNIPFGTYTLKETATLDTHLLNTEVKEVVVTSTTEVYEFSYVNERRKGDIEILKVDAETKAPLANAKFRVQSANGFSEVVTTNSSGIAKVTGAPLGTYTILEITAPDGYTLNPTRFTIEVKEHGKKYPIEITNEKAEGGVSVTKTNDVGNRLTGATFELKSTDGSYVRTLTTDSTGVVTFERVPFGSYTIKETKAPVGYLINPQAHKVTVDTAGKVYTFTHVNDKIKGDIEITKISKLTKEPLANAEFRITGPGNFDQTVKTGNNGIALLEDVPYGEYTIVETKAPSGYIKDTTPHTINITENGKKYSITLENDRAAGHVKVVKTGDDGRLLPNAVFELDPMPKGIDTYTATTDENGVAMFEDIPFGEYTLREAEAPEGYVLNTTVHEVTVDESEKTYTYDYVNIQKKGNISILKIDAESREPLAGIEFDILDTNNNVVDKLVTDEAGKAKSKPLVVGTYKIRETKTKPNYVLNTKEVVVEINEHEQVTYEQIENRKAKGTLELTKSDIATGALLPNAKFRIYAEDKKTVLKEGVTDDNGRATFVLEMGKYYYQEYDAPDNYIIDESLFPFEIKADGEIIKAQMKNVRESIDVNIHKTGTEFKVGLEGAVFQIHQNGKPMTFSVDGKAVTNFTTDKNGNISLPQKLDVGKYQIVEVKAPTGYNLVEPKDFEITPKLVGDGYQEVTYEIVNEEIRGNVKLVKTENEINKVLEGVKFELVRLTNVLGEEVNEKVGEYTTDANGVIEVKDLLYGTYQFKEIQANEGYLIDETPIPFVIQEQGHTIEVGMDNKIIKGGVQLLKTDSEDQRELSNVTFNLYQVSESLEGVELPPVNNPQGEDSQGEVPQEEDAPTEEPTLVENTKAVLNNIVGEVKEVFNAEEDSSTEGGEQPQEEEEQPQEEEETYDPDKDEYAHLGKYIGTYKTNDKGILQADNLRYGHYILVETSPAEGYIGKGQTLEFVVQEHEHIVEVSMVNDKITGKLELTKKDVANGDLLPDAGFRIYAEDKETVLVEGRTDEKGKATFELNYGKYFYQEFDAPEGYIIDESLFPFEIKEDGEIVKAEMTNKKIEGKLQLNKTDISTGELLPNAKFEIYDETGENVVAKGKTDENGLAEFNLDYGKYFYREFEAPNGYLVDDSKFPFEIKEDGEIVKCEMTNVMKKANIKVTKIDSKSKETLEGAVFELYNSKNEVISTGVTNDKGVLEIKELPLGYYYFKEKTAPEGYILDDSKHKFSLEEHEQVVELEITNEKEPEEVTETVPFRLPTTGTYLLKLGLPLAIVACSGAFVYSKRKR